MAVFAMFPDDSREEHTAEQVRTYMITSVTDKGETEDQVVEMKRVATRRGFVVELVSDLLSMMDSKELMTFLETTYKFTTETALPGMIRRVASNKRDFWEVTVLRSTVDPGSELINFVKESKKEATAEYIKKVILFVGAMIGKSVDDCVLAVAEKTRCGPKDSTWVGEPVHYSKRTTWKFLHNCTMPESVAALAVLSVTPLNDVADNSTIEMNLGFPNTTFKIFEGATYFYGGTKDWLFEEHHIDGPELAVREVVILRLLFNGSPKPPAAPQQLAESPERFGTREPRSFKSEDKEGHVSRIAKRGDFIVEFASNLFPERNRPKLVDFLESTYEVLTDTTLPGMIERVASNKRDFWEVTVLRSTVDPSRELINFVTESQKEATAEYIENLIQRVGSIIGRSAGDCVLAIAEKIKCGPKDSSWVAAYEPVYYSKRTTWRFLHSSETHLLIGALVVVNVAPLDDVEGDNSLIQMDLAFPDITFKLLETATYFYGGTSDWVSEEHHIDGPQRAAREVTIMRLLFQDCPAPSRTAGLFGGILCVPKTPGREAVGRAALS